MGLSEVIDTVTTSDASASYKPDRGIFTYAMRLAGCQPEAAVMIGDSRLRDVGGGKAAGMRTLWFEAPDALPPTATPSPTAPSSTSPNFPTPSAASGPELRVWRAKGRPRPVSLRERLNFMVNATPYVPINSIRIVTAASLFDGHDASINIMRRILQSSGRKSSTSATTAVWRKW